MDAIKNTVRNAQLRLRAAQIAYHKPGCCIAYRPGECSCGMLGRRPEPIEQIEDSARRALLSTLQPKTQ